MFYEKIAYKFSKIFVFIVAIITAALLNVSCSGSDSTDNSDDSDTIPFELADQEVFEYKGNWVQAAIFNNRVVALDGDGMIWEWGKYTDFIGSDYHESPISMSMDSDWIAVKGSVFHTVSIKEDGTLWAWGHNEDGQLGDGTYEEKDVPPQIGEDADWESLSIGWDYTMALKTNGTLWAWGSNLSGQLGDGTKINKNSPVQIGDTSDWVKIETGVDYHSVALKIDGTLWAWGNNMDGQLGDGTYENKLVPTQIGADTDWVSFACGGGHHLAIKADGTLWAWGKNYRGQLGDGTDEDKITPIQIGVDTDWEVTAGGFAHSVALKIDGTLWAWGANNDGQLGDGTHVNKTSPIQIGDDSNWVSIEAGDSTLALNSEGTIWVYGELFHTAFSYY